MPKTPTNTLDVTNIPTLRGWAEAWDKYVREHGQSPARMLINEEQKMLMTFTVLGFVNSYRGTPLEVRSDTIPT